MCCCQAGLRQLVSWDLDTEWAEFVQFYLRVGGDWAECNQADSREEGVLLQYSNDGGISWGLIAEMYFTDFTKPRWGSEGGGKINVVLSFAVSCCLFRRADRVFVKGNVIHQSPFLFSASSTMSFLWPPRRPPQGSAGGSLFTLGRAMTSGQSMMSSFCQRGRNILSPWPIQPCHRSGIGFYHLYIMCCTLWMLF